MDVLTSDIFGFTTLVEWVSCATLMLMTSLLLAIALRN